MSCLTYFGVVKMYDRLCICGTVLVPAGPRMMKLPVSEHTALTTFFCARVNVTESVMVC